MITDHQRLMNKVRDNSGDQDDLSEPFLTTQKVKADLRLEEKDTDTLDIDILEHLIPLSDLSISTGMALNKSLAHSLQEAERKEGKGQFSTAEINHILEQREKSAQEIFEKSYELLRKRVMTIATILRHHDVIPSKDFFMSTGMFKGTGLLERVLDAEEGTDYVKKAEARQKKQLKLTNAVLKSF